jgi:tetratricopeptide (TPR) repeat protein
VTEQVLANPDLARGLGDVLRAEVERAVVEVIAGAFRTLADELPRLLARPPAAPPPAVSSVGTTTFSFDCTSEVTCPPQIVPEPPPPPAPEPPGLCALPCDGEAARALYLRALAHGRAGDLGAAVGDCDEAIRLHPAYVTAYLARGQALRLLGQLDRATDDFRRAAELDPTNPAVSHLLAQACLAQGLWDEARAACTDAIRLDPSRAAAFLWRGMAHSGLGDHDGAVADAGRALALNPALTGAYLLRATACARQGKNDRAIADLTRVLELEPEHAAAYHARGLAHANKGNYDQAVLDYNRALRLKPKLLAARFHRALAYRLKGEYAIAAAEFGAVIEARPGYASAHFQRALAYQACGQVELALADLDRVLDLDPGCEEARARRAEVVEAGERAAAAPPPAPALPAPPPSEAAPPVDRNALALTCPGCSAPARINWKRLDRLFQCRKCGRVYRVNAAGHFTKVDPSARARRRVPVPWAVAAGVAVCLVAVVAGALVYRHYHNRGPSLPELPTELRDRGEVFAKGWLDDDRPLLRRLTATTHDRQLHPWIERHRPPPRREGDGYQIDVRVAKTRPHEAVVTVRVTEGGLAKQVELQMDWVERGETWFFAPTAAPAGKKR